MSLSNWLSIVEFARKNNVSDMTVRRRIKNGKLKAVLQDGKYFIDPALVDEKDDSCLSQYPSVKENSLSLVKDASNINISSKQEESGEQFLDSVLTSENKLGVESSQDAVLKRIDSLLFEFHELKEITQKVIEECNMLTKVYKEKSEIEAEKNNIQSDKYSVELQLKKNEILRLNQRIEDLDMLVCMLDK